MTPRTDRLPLVWLQSDEREGRADCGCTLGYSAGDPAFWMCPLHDAAPDLLKIAKSALSCWGFMLQDPRLPNDERAAAEMMRDRARVAVDKAKGETNA